MEWDQARPIQSRVIHQTNFNSISSFRQQSQLALLSKTVINLLPLEVLDALPNISTGLRLPWPKIMPYTKLLTPAKMGFLMSKCRWHLRSKKFWLYVCLHEQTNKGIPFYLTRSIRYINRVPLPFWKGILDESSHMTLAPTPFEKKFHKSQRNVLLGNKEKRFLQNTFGLLRHEMLASGYFAIIDKHFRLKSDAEPRPLFKFTLHKKSWKINSPNRGYNHSMIFKMSNLRWAQQWSEVKHSLILNQETASHFQFVKTLGAFHIRKLL